LRLVGGSGTAAKVLSGEAPASAAPATMVLRACRRVGIFKLN